MEIPPRDVDVPLRLLLIEDSPGDARLFREYLAESGIEAEVSWETSLADGLDAALREDPDLLVVDMNLPDSEGLETVRSVIAGIGTAPTVVLTGHDDPELGPAAVREGAQDYLEKGKVTPSELRRTIRFALLRARADREIRRHERRFRALISNVSDVISVIAPDGTVLYHSPSVQRVLGYAPEELEGENILEYFHPDNRDRVRRERELQRATASLLEQMKEQSCLYEISRFLHADERALEERLRDAVARIPARFWLEITESAITRATDRIRALRREGFAIFVDDFGTGYSSFHYLRDPELDGLKIDMSFVHGLGESSKGRGLVETMITMGRTLEMPVVAEGIETPEQRDTLTELGCALGQGYLFARPMPPDEVASYLVEESRRRSG